MVQRVSTNNFACAKWIVDANGVNAGATHATIAGAIADASSGEVILIKPGIYTEDLTLKAGVDLVSLSSDFINGQVQIIGKLSYSASGTVNIENIKLTTNGDYFLEVTGANDSVVNVNNCFLDVADNTGINITSTGANRQIVFNGCIGNISAMGITYFTISGSGGDFLAQGVFFTNCHLRNTVNSTTASTASATIRIQYSAIWFPISLTSAGMFSKFTEFACQNINSTAVTSATSGEIDLFHCNISSGTASALSIGAGTQMELTQASVVSSNTNAITGAGTLVYTAISFLGTSSTVNATTQTVRSIGPRIQVDGGAQILSGSGDPSGSVTAPQGSLFLRTDGSSTSTRAYINTNGTTGWTSVTTAS